MIKYPPNIIIISLLQYIAPNIIILLNVQYDLGVCTNKNEYNYAENIDMAVAEFAVPLLPDLFRWHYYGGFINSESTWVCTTLYASIHACHR